MIGDRVCDLYSSPYPSNPRHVIKFFFGGCDQCRKKKSLTNTQVKLVPMIGACTAKGRGDG